jgi:hypothetical protein
MFNFKFVSPSQVLSNLWQEIPQTIKVTFISTFIIGILVHGYMFANIILNCDGILLMGLDGYLSSTLTSGRWFQNFAYSLTGAISAHWTLGIVSVLYIATAVSIIVACLEIKNIYSSILISVALVTFPSTATIFSFMYAADTVYLSFLLSCLAALLCKKFNYGFIFGGIALAFSLGIYQAYISFTAGLLVISLIHEVLSKNNNFKTVLTKSIKYFACLVLGLLFYYIILKVTLYTKGLKVIPSKDVDQIFNTHLSQYYVLIREAYRVFFGFFLKHYFWFTSRLLKKIVFIVLLTSKPAVAVLIWSNNSSLQTTRVSKRDIIINRLLLIALFLLFPLAVNSIYVFVPYVHNIMIYPLSLTYVLAISLIDRLDSSFFNIKSSFKKYVGISICWTVLAIFILVPYNYFVLINGNYFKADIAMRQAYQFSSTLLKNIKDFPDYQKGMPVILYGTRSNAEDVIMNKLEQHVPFYGVMPKNSIINCYSYGSFFLFMGENLNILFPSNADFFDPYRDKLMQLEIYPSKRSMIIIDNKLFIRMG